MINVLYRITKDGRNIDEQVSGFNPLDPKNVDSIIKVVESDKSASFVFTEIVRENFFDEIDECIFAYCVLFDSDKASSTLVYSIDLDVFALSSISCPMIYFYKPEFVKAFRLFARMYEFADDWTLTDADRIESFRDLVKVIYDHDKEDMKSYLDWIIEDRDSACSPTDADCDFDLYRKYNELIYDMGQACRPLTVDEKTYRGLVSIQEAISENIAKLGTDDFDGASCLTLSYKGKRADIFFCAEYIDLAETFISDMCDTIRENL